MKYLKPILAILGLLNKIIPLEVKEELFIKLAEELAKNTKTRFDDDLVKEIKKRRSQKNDKQN